MVPRNESGQIVSTTNTGILKMYELHKEMQINMQEGTQLPSNAIEQYELEVEKGVREYSANVRDNNSRRKMVRLLVEYKVAMFSAGEPTELFFSLWSEKRGVLSEEFLVTLTDKGMPEKIDLLSDMKTIFTDVTREEISEDICLVCRLYRSGGLQAVDTKAAKKKPSRQQDARYRRPFGCSVFPLARCRVGRGRRARLSATP